MKIFYGVQGTGNGHISRARAMARHLHNAGVDTQFMFSGGRREHYFDMQPFGHWWDREGLSFITERGNVKPLKTLMHNSVWRFLREVRNLDLSDYDLVISDFEPITAWAARRQGIACIALGHQYAFQHDIPIEGDSWFSRALIKYFAPGSEQLGLHWHHFEQPILPPIINISETPLPLKNNQVLVYLGFETPEEVIPLLQKFPDQQFVYFGNFKRATEQHNVSLRPLSVSAFKQDLAQSRGVICNAGFELASEALHLGKRLLVKPLHGQMEQLSNALALQTLNLAARMESLAVAPVSDWLKHCEQPDCHYPDVARAIVDWLLQANRCTVAELSSQLWAEARVASSFCAPPRQAGVPASA